MSDLHLFIRDLRTGHYNSTSTALSLQFRSPVSDTTLSVTKGHVYSLRTIISALSRAKWTYVGAAEWIESEVARAAVRDFLENTGQFERIKL